jgi:hypothetical protein
MKLNKGRLTLFLLLMQLATNCLAQIKDVKWEVWQDHPCYKGISVSVLNMGYSKEAGGYLWGVGFKNNYAIPVSFEFFLTIGTERWKGSRSVFKLKPGKTFTDGGDVFTGNLYKTASAEWNVEIGKVCFEGMKCGGAVECYADCDAVQWKPNQQCEPTDKDNNSAMEGGVWQSKNLSKLNIYKLKEAVVAIDLQSKYQIADIFKQISTNAYRRTYSTMQGNLIYLNAKTIDYFWDSCCHTYYNPVSRFSFDLSEWVYDRDKTWKYTMIKNDEGLMMLDIEGGFGQFYKKISANEFGRDSLNWVFTDANHMKLGNKGLTFHRVAVKKQNKKVLTGKATSSPTDCIWQSESNNQPYRIKKEGDVLLFGDVNGNFGAFDPRFGYRKVSEDIYQRIDGHSTWTINFLSSTRYSTSVNGSLSGYANCISLMDNADEWVNVKNNYSIKLVMTDGGVLCNVSGYTIFYPATSSNTYQWSDRPCNPDCYKTVIRMTGTNSFSVEYTNLSGQVNQTDEFVRKKK